MAYKVSVRALCEFTAKRGDLDLRFTPSPTAEQGIEGHALVRAARPSSYLSEITLAGQYENLSVRGRADGYDPDLSQVEEIKTYRGSLEDMPGNHRALHWAQAWIYAHLLCVQYDKPGINIALVYYDIDTAKETVIKEYRDAAWLADYFETQCRSFLQWARQELDHKKNCAELLAALRFPYPAFRAGQRVLAETVYKAVRQKRTVLAQAPTGIGKTLGTLFPALKAWPVEDLDKIFFLTAKTSGRQLALDALSALVPAPASNSDSLRVLELTAREKSCEYPGNACHGDACPLAKGFYDRLPAAREQAVQTHMLDRATLQKVGLQHQVCPYWLAVDLAKWCDVVVGDYNYYFDGSALLYALTAAQQSKVALLVDEGHNLVDRARDMYSTQMRLGDVRQAARHAPAPIKKSLNLLMRRWNALCKQQPEPYSTAAEIPLTLSQAISQAAYAIAEFRDAAPAALDVELQALHFKLLEFQRLDETFGEHSVFEMQTPAASSASHASTIGIRNLIPAPFLAPRFSLCHSATVFSATLAPWAFYRDTLGLPANVAAIDVPSPYSAEQLQVHIAKGISTRYTERAQSLAPISSLLANQYRQAPGNYLAYFSSYAYLDQALSQFTSANPDIPVWKQSPGMQEADKSAFLARFAQDGQGIGFAVLGGAFGEGIDLPGSRLIGAFIATLGLPQFNPLNEATRRVMARTFGHRNGYDYTYLFPGIRKIIQAAGRVVRNETDQGVVYLIDDRFARPEIQRLLPTWWQLY